MDFEADMLSNPLVTLITVEMAFGNRPFEVTSRDNPNHVQVRGTQEIWHKENLINIGLSHLPKDWQYVAWIDADVKFMRPDWAQETINQLQHYKVVQMFTVALDLDPTYTPFQKHIGFAYNYHQFGTNAVTNGGQCPDEKVNNLSGHPGYAWATTREVIDATGGVIDFAILGSGDMHMALAFVNQVGRSFYKGITPSYVRMLNRWQERSHRIVNMSLGYVETTLVHYWHGKKKDRGYGDRWKVLRDNKFDPVMDLHKDTQGLLILDPDRIGLRDGIMKYFRTRNEDSIDM